MTKEEKAIRRYEKIRDSLFPENWKPRPAKEVSTDDDGWVPCGGGRRRLLVAGSGGE